MSVAAILCPIDDLSILLSLRPHTAASGANRHRDRFLPLAIYNAALHMLISFNCTSMLPRRTE